HTLPMVARFLLCGLIRSAGPMFEDRRRPGEVKKKLGKCLGPTGHACPVGGYGDFGLRVLVLAPRARRRETATTRRIALLDGSGIVVTRMAWEPSVNAAPKTKSPKSFRVRCRPSCPPVGARV